MTHDTIKSNASSEMKKMIARILKVMKVFHMCKEIGETEHV